MIFDYPLDIPTLDTTSDTWSYTTFKSKEDFTAFVWDQFKLPGSYNLKKTYEWQRPYHYFKKHGYFTPSVKGSPQYFKFWGSEAKNIFKGTEKEKVQRGVIIDGVYIPPFYYMYLNFVEIYNKVVGRFTCPDVWDSDLHMFLYITLCILEGKHAAIVKTRQRGYSYKIMMVLYWSYMWFEGSVNTIGASDEDYVKKTWKYLDQYRQFIHKHTAWKRGPNVPKSMDWTERTLTSEGDYVGLGSTLSGTTFKQSPSKGVGGPQRFFFYEEAGIAPTLLKTIEYIRPAIEEGNFTTGTIIVSGSVGELKDCEDLKKISRNPEAYNFLGVPPVHKDDEVLTKTCFFVPDSWSRFGYVDKDGNSMVAEAEADIIERRIFSKDNKTLEDYQLQISQKPLSLKEAFAFRSDSYFPQAILANQIQRLDIEKPKLTVVELFEKEDGTISFTTNTETTPIVNFPLTAKDDTRGAIVIKEFPEKDAPFLTYFAGVDPVSTDKTTTSESLFSVYIFKTLTETKYQEDGVVKIKVTGFLPVAWYTGRKEDLKATNQIGEMLIRFYSAFAVIESNAQSFINHMQAKGMQRYMATKGDIPFIGELGANKEVHKQYGVHMTPLIKNYILGNIKEYISDELDYVKKDDGSRIKTIYGAERVEDVALLEEIKQWHDGLNTDRIIAFGLAQSMAKTYIVNGIINRKSEIKEHQEFASPKQRGFFKTLDGGHFTRSSSKQFFKNLR
jgi:hypothetical protein